MARAAAWRALLLLSIICAALLSFSAAVDVDSDPQQTSFAPSPVDTVTGSTVSEPHGSAAIPDDPEEPLPETVAPSLDESPNDLDQNDSAGETEATPAPGPGPAPAPAPTSYKNITSDMKAIMLRVGQVNCTDTVRRNIFLIYQNNRALFDQCVLDSRYQIFPYSGTLPTREETTAICQSNACMTLLTGVIRAKFPECDIDMFSIRTSAEVMLRIRTDLRNGRAAPTQVQLDEFYNLNRVVNLLTESPGLIEHVFQESQTRISMSEMTRLMNPIELDPRVTIKEDMTILMNGESATDALDEATSQATQRAAKGNDTAEAVDAESSALSTSLTVVHGTIRLLLLMMILQG